MARLAMINKEKRKLEKALRYRKYRGELRQAGRDLTLTQEQRDEAQVKLQKLPRHSAMARVRNRCLLTGRARGYLRKFKMSRLAVREFANRGLLPGVTKASW